jgi:hypothetical protein
MGRCKFSQPRSFSLEGGQTGPAQRGWLDRPGLAVQPPPRILGREVFEVVSRVVSVLEVVVLVVGLESLQVVILLGVLPLVLNTGMGGVVAFEDHVWFEDRRMVASLLMSD